MVSIKNVQHSQELVRLFDETCLNPKSTCIMGSSVLSVRDLRINGDIDLCVLPEDYVKLPRTLDFRHITIGTHRYACVGITAKELILKNKYHDVISGIKFARPEIEMSVKLYLQRDKDIRDISILGRHACEVDDWDWGLVKTRSRNYNKIKNLVSALDEGGVKFAYKLIINNLI